MNERQWEELNEILRRVRGGGDVTPVFEFLDANAKAEDVPRLMGLMNDEDIVVREVVSGPLGRLAGPADLPQLLAVLQRGIDEGHDCDSLQAALVEIAETHKVSAQQVLTVLTKSSDRATRENAEWLLEFCEDPPNA